MQRATTYLTDDQVELVLSTTRNKKHITWLLLIIDGGLKVTEIVSLRYDQVDLKARAIHLPPASKKNIEDSRTIPLSSRLYQAITDYMSIQDSHEEKYLFRGKEKHVSRKSIYKLCYSIRQKYTTLHQLTPKALRNTFILRYLNAGIPLPQLKAMIGMKNIATLARHLPSFSKAEEAIELVRSPSVKETMLDLIKRWLWKGNPIPVQHIPCSYPVAPIRKK
jgi:integrase